MSATEPTPNVAVDSPESPPAEPLRNAILFACETLVPGGSNLVKGNVKQGLIHGAGGLVARSIFGLPGMILVGSNSFVKATTGRHLYDLLGYGKRDTQGPVT